MQSATRLMTVAVLDGDETLWQETRSTLEGQTTEEWQSLVVQNTPDRSEALEEDVKTVVLRQAKRQELSLCWKRAIRFALSRWEGQDLSKRYLVFVRPGVLFGQEALKRFLEKLDREPEIGMLGATVCAASQEQDSDERRVYTFSPTILSAGQALNRFRRPIHLLQGRDRKELVSPMVWFAPAPHAFIVRAAELSTPEMAEWLDERSILPCSPEHLLAVLTATGTLSERLDDAAIWWPASLSLDRGKSSLEMYRCFRIAESAMDNGWWRLRHFPWLFIRMLYGWLLFIVSPKQWPQTLDYWKQRFVAYRWHYRFRAQSIGASKRRSWFTPLVGADKI
ncbi:MAG: hypothetical protein KC582_01215 [Candidatus Magasanikbacteria bacterium]|nr:hypothetical protein [Candidatus Magasanikbacteria bacterium]MCA9389225.1 hypothetical protein [Candidatus Magasanikbacteria bacterium]MCA9390855.1 hypothetical protein [Candidatus Magasanikbacteria bacterium]USN52200.1 MAG: hypothetical protein H6759_04165 [Candidatus Nomurabacteria bacterium]HPF95089.1 hypothetical protein [bacterium]